MHRFHHVNTKRRFNYPLVTASIISVCRQPCNLLPRRLSAAADLSVNSGATGVCPAPCHSHSAWSHHSERAPTHTHTDVTLSKWIPSDWIILLPHKILNLVDEITYAKTPKSITRMPISSANSRRFFLLSDGVTFMVPRLIRQMKHRRPCQFRSCLSPVIQLNKEVAWTHRCSLITNSAPPSHLGHLTQPLALSSRVSAGLFQSCFSPLTASLLFTAGSLAQLQQWFGWFRVLRRRK